MNQPITDMHWEMLAKLIDRLTRQQASAVIEYVSEELGLTLPRDVTRNFCIACHAAEGEGEKLAV